MKRIIAFALIALALSACAYSAHAFGLGEGNRFGRLGAFKKNGGSAPPPSSCDGTINLSTGCVMPMLR